MYTYVYEKNSLPGSRTQLSRVTGACTNRYTSKDVQEHGDDLLHTAGSQIILVIMEKSTFLRLSALYYQKEGRNKVWNNSKLILIIKYYAG